MILLCLWCSVPALLATAVRLAWSPVAGADVEAYRLSFGTNPGVYSTHVDAGPATAATLMDLASGTRYYFVVRAIGNGGEEGPVSGETSYMVPTASSVPADDVLMLIPQSDWSVHGQINEESSAFAAELAFDGDPTSIWHTAWSSGVTGLPHDLMIDMGQVHPVGGFRYLPRPDALTVGTIAKYEFHVSMDGVNWGEPMASGVFANTKNEKEVLFAAKHGRYIRLRNIEEVSGRSYTSVAEIGVLSVSTDELPPLPPPPAENSAPVASGGSVTTAEDTAVSVVLTATDKDGDALTYVVFSQPSKGVLSGIAPNLTYTPNPDVHGSDFFTFRANDGKVDSNTATVTITITPVNDAPVASGGSVTTAEDTAVSVVLSATDKDGDALTYVIVSQPSKGVLSGNAPNLTYTPNPDVHGSDSFTFRANDGKVDSNTATVTITITPVNDAPVASAKSVTTAEDTAVSVVLSATDKDGDTLTYVVVSQPSKGVLSGIAPNLTYTPNPDVHGSDSFTFRANDGKVNSNTATVTITITPADKADLVDRSGWSLHYVSSEDEEVRRAVGAFDGDASSFWHTRWRSDAPPPPHEIQINLGGVHLLKGFRYLPRQDSFLVGNIARYEFHVSMNGKDWGDPVAKGEFPNTKTEKEVPFAEVRARFIRLISLEESNGAGHCAVAELNVLGTPASNRAPVAEAAEEVTFEGQSVAVLLSGNDWDGDPLAFDLLSPPSRGSLSGTPPALIYTPAAGFIGKDKFSFKVNDGLADSDPATFTVHVTEKKQVPFPPPVAPPPVAPPPVAPPPVKPPVVKPSPPVFVRQVYHSVGFRVGAAVSGKPSIASSARPAAVTDRVSYSKAAGPAWLRIAPNGSLSGTPPLGAVGLNRFSVRATNQAGQSSRAVLQVNVKSTGLPLPWRLREMGALPVKGDASQRAGVFLLRSGGRLTTSADSGNFAWRTLSGDGSITARVGTPRNGNKATRAGLMIRDSHAPRARSLFLGLDGEGVIRWQRRNQPAGKSIATSHGRGLKAGTWMRLVRRGDVITAFKSNNGKKWVRVGSTNIKFRKNCQIGISMAGGRKSLSSAMFRNVIVRNTPAKLRR